LQCDGGKEFRGSVATLMEEHNVTIRISSTYSHRSQSIVERFNRTLAEKLYRSQYAIEFLLPSGERSRTWVRALPNVIDELNNSVTRLIGMRPIDAIKLEKVVAKPSLPVRRPIGHHEPQLSMDVTVRYLLAPGELEGGERRRATDPIWSPQLYDLKKIICSHNQPVLYYLENGPKRAFVREELMPVDPDLVMYPPNSVLSA
jgi:hypothetical protein